MRTIEQTIYSFNELSESAKEKAREWFRNASSDDSFYAESVIEDAATIADLMGIDLRQTRKTHMDKTSFYAPTIFYSGFWSQGDGACFECSYKYKKGSVKAVMNYAPKDAELHRIAKGLQAIQRKYFYSLQATSKHSGHYYHSGCMRVSVDYVGNQIDRETEKGEYEITQLLRDFADWIYKQLESAYDFSVSDECVDDNIICNEYEFFENGMMI